MLASAIDGVPGLFTAQVTLGGLPSGECVTMVFVVGADPHDPTKHNAHELARRYEEWREAVKARYKK